MGNEFAVGIVIIMNRHFALDDLDDVDILVSTSASCFAGDRLHLHVRDDAHLKQHVVDAVIMKVVTTSQTRLPTGRMSMLTEGPYFV